jgi:hypothetical protein
MADRPFMADVGYSLKSVLCVRPTISDRLTSIFGKQSCIFAHDRQKRRKENSADSGATAIFKTE